jgi:hypothetical protein
VPSKPKKLGRPKLGKGEARAHVRPVRFTPEELKRIEAAAKAKGQTVSHWIRSTLNAAMEA